MREYIRKRVLQSGTDVNRHRENVQLDDDYYEYDMKSFSASKSKKASDQQEMVSLTLNNASTAAAAAAAAAASSYSSNKGHYELASPLHLALNGTVQEVLPSPSSSSLSGVDQQLLSIEIQKLHHGRLRTIVFHPLQCMLTSWGQLTEWIGISAMRCWMVLMVAILIEIYATTLMKMSVDASDEIAHGNASKIKPGRTMILSLSCYICSLAMFGISLKQIDVGIAYAIWSALGTATVAIAGMMWFGEPYTFGKMVSLAMILLGVVGLNLADSH